MSKYPILDNHSEPITELVLVRLRSIDEQEAADVLDARMRVLEASWKRTFIERGLILLEVESRELWRWMVKPLTSEKYTSMSHWLANAATHSISDCRAALSAVKELRDVPREDLMAMPRCNISLLTQLSSEVRRDESVIKDAQTMTETQFTAKIAADHPLQHFESRKKITFKPVTSAGVIIEQAIELVMSQEDLATREAALEWLCAEYLLKHMEAE